jgi:hypothetical protein
MKNVALAFSALFMILTSCSSDSSSSSSSEVLLQNEIVTDASDGSSYTMTYMYSGTNLTKISYDDDGSYDKYYYTGDLITKIEFFDDADVLKEKTTYTYNSDSKLASYVSVNYVNDNGEREVYTYNTDGTVSGVSYYGDSVTQTTPSSTRTITLSNGEVISEVSTSGSGTTFTYTYDTKNHPYKNIKGFDKIGAYSDSDNIGVAHNILTRVRTSGTITNTENNSYTYNSDNYPLTASSSTLGVVYETVQYIYQ